MRIIEIEVTVHTQCWYSVENRTTYIEMQQTCICSSTVAAPRSPSTNTEISALGSHDILTDTLSTKRIKITCFTLNCVGALCVEVSILLEQWGRGQITFLTSQPQIAFSPL